MKDQYVRWKNEKARKEAAREQEKIIERLEAGRQAAERLRQERERDGGENPGPAEN